MRRLTTIALAACALALGACGDEDLDVAAYSCADFQRSLKTKDDSTAGEFIRKLRERADLGQPRAAEERTMAASIFFACRGKPGSYKPADKAVQNAKDLRAGKNIVPKAKKKPSSSEKDDSSK